MCSYIRAFLICMNVLFLYIHDRFFSRMHVGFVSYICAFFFSFAEAFFFFVFLHDRCVFVCMGVLFSYVCVVFVLRALCFVCRLDCSRAQVSFFS